jgi:hypothetical protein
MLRSDFCRSIFVKPFDLDFCRDAEAGYASVLRNAVDDGLNQK